MLKKMKVGLAAGLVMLLGARYGMADTISVHDLTQNTTTGVFTYQIQLDSQADVKTGDGFVIYDFAGLTSATFTGLGAGDTEFALSTSLTGNSLNDSASLNLLGSIEAANDSIIFDQATIPNLSFVFNGPTPLTGANLGILTLTTSVLGGKTTTVYSSVDHSSNSVDPSGFAQGPLLVPIAGIIPPVGVPEINASAMASLLIVIVGGVALREAKTRRA